MLLKISDFTNCPSEPHYYKELSLTLLVFSKYSPSDLWKSGPVSSIVYNTFTGNIIIGFNIANFIDISYTLRSNFKTINNKISAGYTWRF